MAAGGLTPRARNLLLLAFMLLAGASLYRLYFAPPPDGMASFRGQTMGTLYSVKVAGEDLRSPERSRIATAIGATLIHVNSLMSNWDPRSELSRFNRSQSTEPFDVSPETAEVLAIARATSELSGGAFDVTVAPLVAAWGFGSDAQAPEAPSDAEIAMLKEQIGWEGLTIDRERNTLTKARPELVADLSAIAKGYGVDAVAKRLEQLGHTSYLVEIGGEMRARGLRPDGNVWRVAIERPDPQQRAVHQVLELRDLALATSGDYRNFWDDGAQRNSHTIDPRTGHPIRHGLASVSVAASDATHADALATMFNVLGLEEGLALAKREGIAAFFVERLPNGQFRSHVTAAFEPLLAPAAPPAAMKPDGDGDAGYPSALPR